MVICFHCRFFLFCFESSSLVYLELWLCICIKSWGKSWYVLLLNTSIVKIHGPIVRKMNLFDGVWLVDRHEVRLLKGDTSVEILLVKTWHNAHSNDPQKAAKEVLISLDEFQAHFEMWSGNILTFTKGMYLKKEQRFHIWSIMGDIRINFADVFDSENELEFSSDSGI